MDNKTRIIIGVVFVVLFLVAVVAFEATQTTSEPNNITKQKDTQVQIQNKTNNVEKTKPVMVVKTEQSVNVDKSSKVNTEPKSIIIDKSSKVNTKPNDSAKNDICHVRIRGGAVESHQVTVEVDSYSRLQKLIALYSIEE